jgi:hypothetical protein
MNKKSNNRQTVKKRESTMLNKLFFAILGFALAKRGDKMTENIKDRWYLYLILTVMVILTGAGIVYGAGQSSTNYAIEIDVLGGGGGWGSSATYELSHTTGQSSPIGPSSSSGYSAYAGFWYAVTGYMPLLPVEETIILCPSGLEFGETQVGTSRKMSVRMQNFRDTDLEVYTVTDPLDPFFIIGDDCSNTALAPGDTCAITVEFSPDSGGTFYDGFEVPTDDPEAGTVTVDVGGTGVTE